MRVYHRVIRITGVVAIKYKYEIKHSESRSHFSAVIHAKKKQLI